MDTVPAAHMVTMTDNDNGINDENALPLPEEEDNLQGPVRRGGAVPPGDELRPSGNPVPGRLQKLGALPGAGGGTCHAGGGLREHGNVSPHTETATMSEHRRGRVSLAV